MGKGGFTLLEVMLAVAILAMISSMVGFGLSSSVAVMEATGDQKEIYRQARVTFERITEDLSSALSDEQAVFEGTPKEIDGVRADALRLHSLAHLSLSGGDDLPGATAITYIVEEDEEAPGSLKLLRSDGLLIYGKDEKAPVYALAEDLRSFALRYQNAEGQKSDTWEQEGGDEEQARPIALPAAVFITMEFWLDKEQETSLAFETAVWMPTGVIRQSGAADG
ncbi:MAG: hypothetical protein CSB34_05335 [Desulfobulbus propionicus]|nr:MAG: hypothetical protein CSB34_05335 [Desulfobulbus propionicus]